MEMYADEDARGGVLEPEGIVGIKYRKERQLETMARLDETYGNLKRRSLQKDLSPEEQTEIKNAMTERETLLLPVYLQIALQYSDLHDRAGRMKAKANCVPCDWENSRRAIYWSLRRKLSELRILKKLASANPTLTYPERKGLYEQLLPEELLADGSDSEVAAFLEKNGDKVESFVQQVRDEWCADQVVDWAQTNQQGVLEGFQRILDGLAPEERTAFIQQLSQQAQAEAEAFGPMPQAAACPPRY